jgi:hypothetical protein
VRLQSPPVARSIHHPGPRDTQCEAGSSGSGEFACPRRIRTEDGAATRRARSHPMKLRSVSRNGSKTDAGQGSKERCDLPDHHARPGDEMQCICPAGSGAIASSTSDRRWGRGPRRLQVGGLGRAGGIASRLTDREASEHRDLVVGPHIRLPAPATGRIGGLAGRPLRPGRGAGGRTSIAGRTAKRGRWPARHRARRSEPGRIGGWDVPRELAPRLADRRSRIRARKDPRGALDRVSQNVPADVLGALERQRG